MKYTVRYHLYQREQFQSKHSLFRTMNWLVTCALVLLTMTGCTLQRDEHTVQFQQLQQPNEQSESLPVWMDVYSKSVVHDVYSPQGNTEILP